MWSKTEHKALPKKPPSMYRAYYALAKLGRWHDSKATGIVGWEALWDGWFVLSQLLEGAILMQQQIKEMRSSHINKYLPEIEPYLALLPGHRFLVADSYEDVWYDSSLISI
jgi:hypothetical protein